MTEQQIQNTLSFLSRVDLKGGEVPAFNEIITALNELLELIKKQESTTKKSSCSEIPNS